MKHSLLDKLACPECAKNLLLREFKASNKEIESGILLCDSCSSFYIISRFIPRMLPNFSDEAFANEHGRELGKLGNWQLAGTKENDPLKALKQKTKGSFGFEWELWGRFGWDEDVDMEKTRQIFEYKVMKKRGELEGKLVLDAGCGNGRYTAVAEEYGGEVVGIDLSEAVDTAHRNLKGNPKVHIVQGDLFRPPFKKELFDFVFSNGVLMHTGNAKQAFFSLTRHLKTDGEITIHMYHKGNPLYEFNDWWIRAITTRLPLPLMYKLSKIAAGAAKIMPKKFVEYGLNMFFRIEPHPHYVFDWYTAPIATHHTYPEVYGWLKEAGLSLIADHNATKYPWRKWILPFFFLTVKAKKGIFENVPQHIIK